MLHDATSENILPNNVLDPHAFYADLDPDLVKNLNAYPDPTRKKWKGSFRNKGSFQTTRDNIF
jgi:hypothetical protein